jgi:branched-chain amino acid transport system permease protein
MGELLSGFWVVTLISAGLNAIITTGVYFSSSAGSFTVAHAALAGMGGYASALLTRDLGYPMWVGVLAGAALAFLSGLLLGWVSSRMHPLVAGLATMAFAEVMVVVAFNTESLGGATGLTGIPLKTNLGLVYLVLALSLFAAWRFHRSRLGYAAHAIRDSMRAADVMGVNVVWVKALVFGIGSAVAAVGGALHAHYLMVQTAGDMGFWGGMNYSFFWIFGGSYTFWGPAVGAMVLTILPEVLRFSMNARYIMYGLLLMVVVVVRPQGLIPVMPMGTRFELPAWLRGRKLLTATNRARRR